MLKVIEHEYYMFLCHICQTLHLSNSQAGSVVALSLKSEIDVYFIFWKFSGWCSAKGQTGNCFTKRILINPPLCGFHNFTSLILSCTVRLYKVVMGWLAVYHDRQSSEISFGKRCFWKFLQQNPPHRRQHQQVSGKYENNKMCTFHQLALSFSRNSIRVLLKSFDHNLSFNIRSRNKPMLWYSGLANPL